MSNEQREGIKGNQIGTIRATTTPRLPRPLGWQTRAVRGCLTQ